jgi:hypothetical protein
VKERNQREDCKIPEVWPWWVLHDKWISGLPLLFPYCLKAVISHLEFIWILWAFVTWQGNLDPLLGGSEHLGSFKNFMLAISREEM